MKRSFRNLVPLFLFTSLALPLHAQHQADGPILVLDTGGHTAAVEDVLFTPDGRQIISVSDDRTIRIWDVESSMPRRVLRPPIGAGFVGRLYAAALSRDGRTLAVGGWCGEGEDNPIYLIRLPDGQIEGVLRGHTDVVYDLAWNANQLVSASADCTARIWDGPNRTLLGTLSGHRAAVRHVVWSPDGRRIATASDDHTALVWDVASGRTEAILRGHEDALTCIAWRPDGQELATTGRDRSVRYWRPDGASLASILSLANWTAAAAYSPDGASLVVTLGGGGTSRYECLVLDTQHRELGRYESHHNAVIGVCFSPDGHLVATGDFVGTVDVWDPRTLSRNGRLAGRGKAVFSVGWGPGDTVIAFGQTRHDASYLDYGPLERVFDPVELSVIDAPAVPFRRAQAHHAGLTLVPVGGTRLDVRREGRSSTIELGSSDRLLTYTFFGERSVAVGSNLGLTLYDSFSGRLLLRDQEHHGMVFAMAPSADSRYLLTGGNDEVVRVMAAGRTRPVLSVFPSGDDWIAWTPEGYYACSPGGERLVGWQISNGPDRMASYSPAADFHDQFYRPDALRRLLQTGDISQALQGQLGTPIATQTIEENLPPLVVITSPDQSGTTLANGELEVRAVVRGRARQPISSCRLLVDGRPYEGELGRKNVVRDRPIRPMPDLASLEEVRERWDVTLAPGRHRLAVRAQSGSVAATSEPVEVVVPDPTAVRPRLFVLSIGVSDYTDDRLDLRYADRDAQALGRALRDGSTGLFESVQVKILTDAQATRRGILGSFRWLKEQLASTDIAVIAFSGHGDVDSDGMFYLVPSDFEIGDLESTGVPSSQFKATLAGLKGRVLVLLDACHAGAADRGGRQTRGISFTDDLARTLSSDDYGVIVMCSSTGSELSEERDDIGGGLFTVAVVEALGGKADYDRDRHVDVTELDSYVSSRVKQLSGGRQRPVTAKPASVVPFSLTSH